MEWKIKEKKKTLNYSGYYWRLHRSRVTWFRHLGSFRTARRRMQIQARDRSENFSLISALALTKRTFKGKRQAEEIKGNTRKRRSWRCHKLGRVQHQWLARGEERIAGVVRGSWVVCWNGWPRLPFSPARAPRTSPLPASISSPRPPPHSQPLRVRSTAPSPALSSSLFYPFLLPSTLALRRPKSEEEEEEEEEEDAEAVETGAGVGHQVLQRGGRRGGSQRRERPRAVPPGALRVLAPPRLLPPPVLHDQQPGHAQGRQGHRRRQRGGRRAGRGPDAAALLQPQRATRRHARLLQRLPPRRRRIRHRPQGIRRRRHAAGPRGPARRRQAARHRRPPGPQGVAGRGDLPWSVPAPAPGEAPGLLLRGRGAPPGLRVHAARQPREPPLQEDIGHAAVGHQAQGRHRSRKGARLPPWRQTARHLQGLQGIQHPTRLGIHGEAIGLWSGEDGSRGGGDARDHARDGHPRLRGAGVRPDGPPDDEERRVQLRRGAAGAPHWPPRHGARPGPDRARRADHQARRLDAPLPRQQPAAALHHGPEAGGALLRQGRARRGAPGGAVHERAAAGQAEHGGRGGGAGAAGRVQGHGRQPRALAHRARGREERAVRQVPRRDEGRRRGRRGAAEERVRQAGLIDDRVPASLITLRTPACLPRRLN